MKWGWRAFFGVGFFGMERGRRGWLVAGVPLLALHSEGLGKRLTLWVGCGMLGKKEGPAPGSSPHSFSKSRYRL